MVSDFKKMIFDRFANAAGLAAVVELRLRLLASKTPELEKFAHDQNLEVLENKVFSHFSKHITIEEIEYLKNARGLRNKILHSDFKASAKKSDELVESKNNNPGVVALKISTNEVKSVSEMTKREGGVFGWMLECAQTGVFNEAADIFIKADSIYNRISYDSAMDELDPESVAMFRKTFGNTNDDKS